MKHILKIFVVEYPLSDRDIQLMYLNVLVAVVGYQCERGFTVTENREI